MHAYTVITQFFDHDGQPTTEVQNSMDQQHARKLYQKTVAKITADHSDDWSAPEETVSAGPVSQEMQAKFFALEDEWDEYEHDFITFESLKATVSLYGRSV